MSGKTTCQYCAGLIDPGMETCPRCGAPVAVELKKAQAEMSLPGRLSTCPDCGKPVSTRAESCPHCGAPIAPRPASFGALRFRKPDWGFEWRTRAQIGRWPLIHVAVGRKDGRLRVARGIVAVGQFAVGFFTLAQFGVAYIFGIGQFLAGPILIAQFALGILFGLGQFASGVVAIGQFAFGGYVLAQIGLGVHAWTTLGKDPQAVQFFGAIKTALFGG